MSPRNTETGCLFLSCQNEKLISLKGRSEKIKIYPAYFLQHMPGTSSDLFLRERVAEKIVKIAERLPANLYLVLIDGWRSYETQSFIYHETMKVFARKGYSQQKINEEIGKYVAYPEKSLEKPAPHYSGGAIDLTLADDQGWINMGTEFDDFTDKANSVYYETDNNLSEEEIQIRNNRRYLRRIMMSETFVPNPTEWWHFSYGDRTWATEYQTQPLYGGIEREN
ncbi:MAG: M15 family metallopeptidase [Sporolactobacillus sp.]